MKIKVNIYVLIDPVTNKVRYIGRSRCDLKKRLREHISKSKKNYDNNHKSNWIRSLLKINSKPIIKCLTTVLGWSESYEVEKCLINKYKDKFNLVNSSDKGEGGLNREISLETKEKISNSLKKYYEKNRDNLSFCKKIYVYKRNGSFFNEYPSIKKAGKELGWKSYTIIHKLLKKSRLKPEKYDYQFSYVKVEKMPNL